MRISQQKKILCVKCLTELMHLPFYNNNNREFVASIPFCPNKECESFGLLVVVYKDRNEKDKENKHEAVQS